MPPRHTLPIRRSTSEASITKRTRTSGRLPASGATQSHLSSLGPLPNATTVCREFGIQTRARSAGDGVEGSSGDPGGPAVVADEGPSPFSCGLCQVVFDSRTLLKNHVLQVHEGKSVVKCPHCERAFTRPSQLRKHIVASHDHRTGEYYCDKCTFKNRELKLFYEHIHVHNKCRFCSNEFPQLSRHESKCPYRE